MDREKVIDGLRHCLPETIIDGLQDCNTCPYQRDCETDATVSMPIRMIEDIRSLRKEQEAKKVLSVADSAEGIEVGYCPSCDRAIVNKKIDETKFCKFCGQAVKWDA